MTAVCRKCGVTDEVTVLYRFRHEFFCAQHALQLMDDRRIKKEDLARCPVE